MIPMLFVCHTDDRWTSGDQIYFPKENSTLTHMAHFPMIHHGNERAGLRPL